MSIKRVVITGLGAITPIGNSIDEIFNNLKNGVSGVGPISRWDASDYPVRIAGEVKFNPADHFDNKQINRLDRISQFAVIASKMAVDDANLVIDDTNRDDIATIIGASMGGVSTIEAECNTMVSRGPGRVSPLVATKSNINIAAAHCSISLGSSGPSWAPGSACAAGSHAIGEAFEMIRREDAKASICGGTEACVQPMSLAGLVALDLLSKRNSEPTKASRPFDAARDGFVLAEGAGVIILEELEFAMQRGARIIAEVVGYGATVNHKDETDMPANKWGASRSMVRALNKASMSPEDIDYINAFAASTIDGDCHEIEAIQHVFGDHAKKVKISSTKSMTGHMQGASGSVELIACALSLYHGIIFPTINLDDPDPDCNLDLVPNKSIEIPLRTAMSNSFGFEGQNATLILKKYEY